MGIQVIGEKKLRKARQATGLDFDRIVRLTNTRWEGRLPQDDGTHVHLEIDKKTWEVGASTHACWSSCWDNPSPRAHSSLPALPRQTPLLELL